MQEELLDKATAVFAEKGYEATSLQDIADVVGISRSALYHYVSSKEALLQMLVEQVSGSLAEVLDQLSAREDMSARDKLVNVVSLLVRQRAAHPDQFRILDRAENALPGPVGAEHLEAKRTIVRRLVAVIEAGIASGEFKSVDPRTAAFSLVGMCNWVAWWFRAGYDIDPVVAAITEFAEAMLLAGPRPASNARRVEMIHEAQALLTRLEESL